MYLYMHALQLNQRANGQRAARHQERAQRPRAVGPKRPQGHRRTRGGIRRDTKRTGGHKDITRTGGHSEDRREQRGGRSGPQGHMDPTSTTPHVSEFNSSYPLRYFINISITMPVVSALKSYYI
jgi:hypothetical protein